MNEINVVSSNPQHIDINQSPDQPKTTRTRREEAELRKQEFYKQMEVARQAESIVLENKTVADQELLPSNFLDEDLESKSIGEEISPIDFDQDAEEEETTGKIIPKKRFDKEIERRKLAEEKYEREREARIKFETELSLYNKALENLQSKQQEQEPELDPIDSDAHNLYMRKIKDLEARLERQHSNLSEYEIRQNFTNTVNHQAAEMMKAKPDFSDAYNYLLSVETQKARMLGYNDTQAQAVALNQLQPVAWQAYNRGENVAEVTYNLAKTYGYKSKSSGEKLPSTPNLDKVEKNMQKSHSIINEVKGVSTKLTPDYAALATLEGYEAKLAGKGGRGTKVDEFYKALEALKGGSQNYGN